MCGGSHCVSTSEQKQHLNIIHHACLLNTNTMHACKAWICTASAQGVYAGVFPVKCNHDREVLECVLESGRPFSYGLEVGSKAEMLMAMAMMGSSPGALLVCNGYKDAAFMRLVRLSGSWAPPCSTPGARPPVHAVLWVPH